MKEFLFVMLLLLSSCYRGHLYVQEEWVDKASLASSWVRTPDYRQEDPPVGQRLLVSWDFPISVYRRHLTLHAVVRFWDNTEKTVAYELKRRRGATDFFFRDESEEQNNKILTYRVQIRAGDGELIETWKHQLWTELIEVDKENSSGFGVEKRREAHSISSSVSFHPRQESVIETP